MVGVLKVDMIQGPFSHRAQHLQDREVRSNLVRKEKRNKNEWGDEMTSAHPEEKCSMKGLQKKSCEPTIQYISLTDTEGQAALSLS